MANLATWIGTAVSVFALAFASWSHFNGRARARLEYVVTTRRRILPGLVTDELEVVHNGALVVDPALTIVRFVNSGENAIRPADFENKLALSLTGDCELVTANWSASRPTELRPSLEIQGNGVLIAPRLINSGDMLEIQLITSGLPASLELAARAANLTVQERQSLPYPPGGGSEGEMNSVDKFMWWVFSPGLILGVGLLVMFGYGATADGQILTAIATALVMAAYLLHARFLVRRRRRWSP